MTEHVTDGLQLYLKMDTVQDEQIQNASGIKYHGRLTGKPTLIDDSIFKKCLRFDRDEDSVVIDDAIGLVNGDLTMSMWIRLDSYSSRITTRITLLRMRMPSSPIFELTIHPDGSHTNVRSLYFSNQYSQTINKKGNYLNDNKWVHVTVSVKENVYLQRLWIQHYVHLRNPDGTLSVVGGGGKARGIPSSRGSFDSKPHLEIVVGKRYQAYNCYGFRAYNRALNLIEIEQNMAADLGIEIITPKESEPEVDAIPTSPSAFRAEFPIDLNLYDSDQQSALYIDDGHPHELNLDLHNRSGRDITFDPAIDDKASATNHHLELKFRPGCLSNKILESLKNGDVKLVEKRWEMGRQGVNSGAYIWDLHISDSKSGVPVSLYLLCKGDKPRVLGADRRCVISLTSMAAAAQQGARGTQVTLKFSQMTFAGPDQLPVTGQRTKQLYVTHAGKHELPLHVGFVGSNRIHTGGRESHLTLRVTNTHKTRIIAGDDWGGKPKLILHFDYGDDAWALCKAKEAGAPNITVDNSTQPTRGQGIAPEWDVSLPTDGIAPGKYIDIKMKIKGAAAGGIGNANLYLTYENITGYAEGRIISTIERSPMSVTENGININGELKASAANFTGPISTGDGAIRWKIIEGEIPGDDSISYDGWITQILDGIPEPDNIINISGRVLCNVEAKYTSMLGFKESTTSRVEKRAFPIIYEFINNDDSPSPVSITHIPKSENTNDHKKTALPSRWELKCLDSHLKQDYIERTEMSDVSYSHNFKFTSRKFRLLIVYTDIDE